ncbi:DUF1801 domain-containing protein [Exilibacterium tricleocarpae]|uniref:DUF1801 domain-containing protein n=1 Tax=Exilibacterium tricleocarpae TaxID=2591008 RepID=A0A545TVX3_9GAMM|nr:DUF1801 domain-containing protein [Exilibacterium tricleocarpae]
MDSYIAARNPAVRTTLAALRALVQPTLPQVTEGMKWGAPIFLDPQGEPVVYLYGGKDHANLGFIRGAELSDPKGILQGRGHLGRHVASIGDARCHDGG